MFSTFTCLFLRRIDELQHDTEVSKETIHLLKLEIEKERNEKEELKLVEKERDDARTLLRAANNKIQVCIV